MRILRAQDRVPVPWKNGGGVTREVLVYPPGASFDDFGWRVSIATVERGGPFSVFAGIDRVIALIDGSMTLTIEGRDDVALSRRSEPYAFPGDAKTSAALTGGPVTDLNVMTRRGAFIARMTRRTVSGALAVDASATTLVFPHAPATANEENLGTGDAILIAPQSSDAVVLSQAEVFWIEITAVR
jgi:environmental stress-induced protein Ves